MGRMPWSRSGSSTAVRVGTGNRLVDDINKVFNTIDKNVVVETEDSRVIADAIWAKAIELGRDKQPGDRIEVAVTSEHHEVNVMEALMSVMLHGGIHENLLAEAAHNNVFMFRKL